MKAAITGFVSCLAVAGSLLAQDAKQKPLMREFMGLNGHTVQFDADLYAPVARLVRDYHPYQWDVKDKVGAETNFPIAMHINWKAPPGKFRDWSAPVNWQELYGGWVQKGWEINACAMFDGVKFSEWPDPAADAYKYGKAFGSYFGPANKKLVTSVEIGNEPAGNKQYSTEQYKIIFENMARGIREADPKLLIASAAVDVKPDGWCSDINVLRDLPELYDVINLHKYAMIKPWPSFERTYPENPELDYLGQLQLNIDWRNQYAPGKQIWLTEFGFDASTKEPTANNKDWKDSTDLQQAQWLVRTFLATVDLDLDRAYMYFFNDGDTPSFHAASGLTRDFEPKPSYWAMSQLYKTLGDYRLTRAVEKNKEGAWVFEFTHGTDADKVVWVAWLATGSDKVEQRKLSIPGKLIKAEAMAVAKATKPLTLKQVGDAGEVSVELSESPVYLWVQK